MPELPEVETVCRSLAKHLTGRSISRVTVRNPRLRTPLCEDQLNTVCAGRKIVNLRRRAKYIIAELDSENALLLHLGMTGKFRLVEQNTSIKKHEHVLFELDNGYSWRYEDTRRFGSIKCVRLPIPGGMPEGLECLGPEPLTSDFDGSVLFKKSRKKTKPLKNFIMDNAVVVGVGNIYAAEALFRAQLSPLREAGSLTKKTASLLSAKIKEILTQAIEAGGTTINDFKTPDGNEGYFFRKLAVYGRYEEACLICSGPIKKVVQAGRSTFYCGKCQK
jgi:formamidopyrimidine-DNA glycosylase